MRLQPKHVVLYARVSTKDTGQDAENQLAQLRDFCAKQEWTISREYDLVSGFKATIATPSAVPEPSTAWLAIGIAALLWMHRQVSRRVRRS
jgi:hypothetical protein